MNADPAVPTNVTSATSVGGDAWYLDRTFWLVLLLAVALYLPRLTLLSIRGEESRRAVIAQEMIETGDWIVPRTQGVVRLSRPPLQNWMIAGIAVLTGEMDAWAIRLPGFFGTLATIALIYWYARQQLGRSGAILSTLIYASTLQVLEQGRTGETEPVFTFLMAAALLTWHGLWATGQRPMAAWMVGGALGALAMLTKGLQAPLYFFGSTWAYLVLTGQWRWLWHRSHPAGIATFLGVVAAWQIPFMAMMGLENGWLIYFVNVAARFHDDRASTFITHLLTYPPAVLLGCLAPWSFLLIAFADPAIRAKLGPRRDTIAFLAISIAICFPSVWLPPEARPRYFMPLFPCFAVLSGAAAILLAETRSPFAEKLWITLVRVARVAMPAAAVGVSIWAAIHPVKPPAPPLNEAMVYAVLVVGVWVVLLRTGTALSLPLMSRAMACVAVFLGLTYLGPILSNQSLRSNRLPEDMAALKQRLPADVRLVSFDHVHHVFLHYFGKTVQLREWPQTIDQAPTDTDYFCVHLESPYLPDLPFAWEQIAAVSVDRNLSLTPKERVIVGRRLSPAEANTHGARHPDGPVTRTAAGDRGPRQLLR